MQKTVSLKIDGLEYDSIIRYADEKNISVSEVFKTGARAVISGNMVTPTVDSLELDRLRAQVAELVDENTSLRDTLEAASADGSRPKVSHTTKFGRDITNHGLTKDLNQAVDNVIYRLRSIPAGSSQRYAKLINSWSNNAIRAFSGNYTPESTKEATEEAKA